jgi:peptidoglycan/LPS O-acetylase OafA/YrhL
VTTAIEARDPSETTGPALARRHYPGFEPLRALAALMVVVHHAAATAGPVRAGRMHTLAAVADSGVAVFFVLSGFLIYRPFAAAHLEGRRGPSTASFWWRRILRIVPAYWIALTFFWWLGSFSLGDQWWRYYLFLQIYSRETVLGGVIQAWSLCTEMTFYLLVPVWAAAVAALVGARRRATSRLVAQLVACGVLWVAGYGSRYLIDHHYQAQRGMAFDWLVTNLDLFATGMTLAVVSAWSVTHPPTRARLDRVAQWVAPWWLAAAALFTWYAYRVGPADFVTGYTGWFWHRRQLVLAVFTLLLMVPAVFGPDDRGPLRRLWHWRPLAWVGTVSYGLYLWHFDWMKRSIARSDGLGRPLWSGWVHSVEGNSNVWYLLAVGLVCGLGFAAASWYLVEQPLQRYKDLVGRPRRPRGIDLEAGAEGGFDG